MAPRRGVSDVTVLPFGRERKRMFYSFREGDLSLGREESNPSLEGCETPFTHHALSLVKVYIITKGTPAPFSSVSTARDLTGHDLWRLKFLTITIVCVGLIFWNTRLVFSVIFPANLLAYGAS